MNIKSLSLKNKLIDERSGEFYYDLTAPTFVYDAELGIKALHYVVQDQVGRIDKISEIYFGTTEYIDAICVINNIFNPFSLQEGDVLVIPNLRRLDLVYQRPEIASRPTPTQEPYIDTGRQSQKDQSRIQRLAQKAKEKKSGVNTPLPPNMLQPGQATKILKNGEIKLGANLPSRNTFINSPDNVNTNSNQ
jgi:hypothetical protein